MATFVILLDKTGFTIFLKLSSGTPVKIKAGSRKINSK